MEPKPKFSEKLRIKSQNIGEAPPKVVVMNGKTLRKQNSVEIIVTEPDETDKTNKTGDMGKSKKDAKDIGINGKDKTNNSVSDVKEKIGAKNLLRVHLLGKGTQNEGIVGKEKGKGNKSALMRLRGSVHTIQLMSKLSR